MPLFPPQFFRKAKGIIRRGTRAAQPLATNVLAGTIYYVTDETVLERSNGAAWQSYSGAYVPPTYTTGSVLFAGVTGAPTQDNTNFFFNDTTNQLKVTGSILSPLIIGGTGVTDDLTLQATSGVGTTGSWIFFTVGNNGAVTAMEINHTGLVGINTTGTVSLQSQLTVRQSNPPDIGIVAQFRSNLSCYLQMRTGTGANEQAGFSLFQVTNNFEWRVSVIGNQENALLFGAGTGGTDIKAVLTQNGNLILNTTVTDPATGTRCLIFGDGTAPATLDSNTAGLYADDVSGTVNIFAINEAGNTTKLTGFTTGSIIFAVTATGFTENNSKFFWDNTNFILKVIHGAGILEAPPTNEIPQIHIGGDFDGVAAGIGVLFIDGYGAQGNITMRRANGTQASPTALADTNIIFNFRSYGYDGSAYAAGGFLRMTANGTWTTSNHGQDFLVLLTANGSTANASERFRVTSNGNVSINNINSEPTAGTKCLIFGDGTVPSGLVSNTAGLYANDVSGTVEIFGINEAGESSQLTGVGKTYTPTRSAETNLDANVTLTEAQYSRAGNTVTVSGRFTADPTLAATATSFEMTLPIASNIGAVEDAAGVAFCGTIAGQGAAISGSVANNTAVISWIAGDITSQSWSYIFSYQVI